MLEDVKLSLETKPELEHETAGVELLKIWG